MKKNWAQIRAINNARKRSAAAAPGPSRPAQPQGQPEEITLSDEEMSNVQEPMATEDGGQDPKSVGGEGKGTAIQEGMPIMPYIPIRSVTIEYEHRQLWQFRNRFCGGRVNTLLGTNSTTLYNTYVSSMVSDEHSLPGQLMGFYLTPYEMEDFTHERFRTWSIDHAGFEIEQVQVLPNTLIGGTDLHYAAPMGINPLCYIPGSKSREYPYYTFGMDAQDGTCPAPVAIGTSPAGADVVNNLMLAKEGVANGMTYQPAYISKSVIGTTNAPNAETIIGFQDDKNIRLLRDYNTMPVTQLAGHKCHFHTWKGKQPMMDFRNRPPYHNAGGPFYDEYTHQETSNQITATRATTQSNDIAASKVLADVRQRYGGGAAHMYMTRNNFATFPVGEMWNNNYHEINGYNQVMRDNNGSNMPFMFKQQDLVAADGKIFDYTTTLTLRSKMVVTFEMDHTGGNGNINPFNNAINNWGTAHHLYGDGGILGQHVQSGSNAIGSLTNTSLIGGATPPPLTDYTDLARLNAPFQTNEIILQNTFAQPLVDADGNIDVYVGPITRSKSKKINAE